jgi:hypothetical protein
MPSAGMARPLAGTGRLARLGRRKMHDYDRAGLAAVVIRLIW